MRATYFDLVNRQQGASRSVAGLASKSIGNGGGKLFVCDPVDIFKFGCAEIGPDEMGLYICQAIGAFPYTNFRYRWNEILGAREQFDPTMETWTPLTKAFQALDFKFLDRVDPTFALEMRSEGKLGGSNSM